MAGIKISELPEASCIIGNELVPIVQGSCTKFAEASAIGSTGQDNITDITTGCGLVGGGSAGSVNIAMDNACFDAFDGTHTTLQATSACWDGNYTTVQTNSGSWDQSACLGLNCVGAITCIQTGIGIDGGGTSGNLCFTLDSACQLRWSGTASTVQANSASWAGGGAGDITDVIAGPGLSGGATSGAATLGLDATTACQLDQSNCLGINCVGDMTLASNQTVTGNKCFQGNILSAGVNLDQLFGTGAGGSVDTVTAGDATISIGGTATNPTVTVSCACKSSWNGAYTTVQTNSADWNSPTDNVTGDGTNNTIAAFSGDHTLIDSKLRQNFTDVIVGATLSATGDLKTSGQILSGGCDLHNLFGSGGTTIAGGTDNKLAMFNSAGDNIEDSIITQPTALQVTVGGTLSADHLAAGTDANVSTSVTGNSVIGGLSGSALSNQSVTIGGCYPYINTTGAANAIVGGERGTIGTSSNRSIVIGGCKNTVSNSTNMVTMIGGEMNVSGSTNCTVFIGGQANSAAAFSSGLIVIGGSCHNATGSNTIYIGDSASCGAAHNVNLSAKLLTLRHLPTSDPASAGAVWSDGGTLKVSAG